MPATIAHGSTGPAGPACDRDPIETQVIPHAFLGWTIWAFPGVIESRTVELIQGRRDSIAVFVFGTALDDGNRMVDHLVFEGDL